MARLNRAAIRAGVAADLALLVPVVAIYAGLRGVGALRGDGGATATAVVGAIAAPVFGGWSAGRSERGTPLTHGAVAAGLASLGFVVFRLADGVVRDRPVHAASLVILMILAMTLGLVGGLLGARTGPPLADSPP